MVVQFHPPLVPLILQRVLEGFVDLLYLCSESSCLAKRLRPFFCLSVLGSVVRDGHRLERVGPQLVGRRV